MSQVNPLFSNQPKKQAEGRNSRPSATLRTRQDNAARRSFFIFTVPATASLLTGTYPWTHRAINHRGMVHQNVVDKNVFRAVGTDYQRLAFPQNVWADLIVSQFANDIDTLLPSGLYGSVDYLKSELFPNDTNMAIRSLDDFV